MEKIYIEIEIADMSNNIKNLQNYIKELENTNKNLQKEKSELMIEESNKNEELIAIKSSRTFKLLNCYYKYKLKKK